MLTLAFGNTSQHRDPVFTFLGGHKVLARVANESIPSGIKLRKTTTWSDDQKKVWRGLRAGRGLIAGDLPAHLEHHVPLLLERDAVGLQERNLLLK